MSASDEEKQFDRIVRAETHLSKELTMIIRRSVHEYDLTHEQIIGCLEMLKIDIYNGSYLDD